MPIHAVQTIEDASTKKKPTCAHYGGGALTYSFPSCVRVDGCFRDDFEVGATNLHFPRIRVHTATNVATKTTKDAIKHMIAHIVAASPVGTFIYTRPHSPPAVITGRKIITTHHL